MNNKKMRLRIRSNKVIESGVLTGADLVVEDIETGKPLDNVYKVEFSITASGILDAQIHIFPSEIDVSFEGQIVKNEGQGVVEATPIGKKYKQYKKVGK